MFAFTSGRSQLVRVIICFKNLLCLGVNSSTGELQTSSTNSTRIEWKYKTDTCPNNYEDLILTEDLFSFNLIKDNNTMYPITEYSLYLPDRFDFYIPPEMQSNEHSLRISLCNQDLTDIPIILKIGKLDERLQQMLQYQDSVYMNYVHITVWESFSWYQECAVPTVFQSFNSKMAAFNLSNPILDFYLLCPSFYSD